MRWMQRTPDKVNRFGCFCYASLSVILATANIEEYMTMIAGGLAGATPHMISATVTAISRLVFEFRGLS